MNISIVSLDGLQLVGLKVVGRRSELSHRVPLAWTELVARLDSVPNAVNPDVLYGVFPESDHLKESVDGVYTYSVCVQVSHLGPVPEGMSARELPPREYAMATALGDASAIGAAYMGLAKWEEEQERKTDVGAECIERYERRRQWVLPPYERFDYDILRPLLASKTPRNG
ncbi:GyrI-like domain-containing protein [Myxococcus sp. K38C18041901]|uniref:GyrI-like domain-containing protein n=1 Tax=Myxococcus guangdongensis TaxID=2906760 RepID=UPI0020A7A1EC|nr:GyrI-like domain-containing protein [Myxococcus guangdongensis]MCP3062536.1 GyrI-like domain-containing protein [Myxococcus guangdongensis]